MAAWSEVGLPDGQGALIASIDTDAATDTDPTPISISISISTTPNPLLLSCALYSLCSRPLSDGNGEGGLGSDFLFSGDPAPAGLEND